MSDERPIHPAIQEVLQFFDYTHLRPPLDDISQKFHDLAHELADELEGAQLTWGLHHLLMAKDYCVRAALGTARR